MDARVKIRENEKGGKYLDLARELIKLWNMKLTVIPIVIGTQGIIPKGFESGLGKLEIGGRIETIQTIAMARILRRVLETRGDSLSLILQ